MGDATQPKKKGKSLRERRQARLAKALEIRNLMEKKGLSYRQAGELFGFSGVMAFKLVKELREYQKTAVSGKLRK